MFLGGPYHYRTNHPCRDARSVRPAGKKLPETTRHSVNGPAISGRVTPSLPELPYHATQFQTEVHPLFQYVGLFILRRNGEGGMFGILDIHSQVAEVIDHLSGYTPTVSRHFRKNQVTDTGYAQASLAQGALTRLFPFTPSFSSSLSLVR